MSILTNELMQKGYLKTGIIIDAFDKIKREDFVPEDLRAVAEKNIPLPIGFGQTISQPLTVAFMLELLEPAEGQIILDVGSGSGWTTSLLSYVVGENGKVVAIERMEELCRFGEKNADKYDFVKKGIAEFHAINAKNGFPKYAPYDRILISAALKDLPQSLKDQLVVGGKIVAPIQNTVTYFEKKEDGEFEKREFAGFAFVPFVDEGK